MTIQKTVLGAAFLLSTIGSTALMAPASADDHEEMGNLTRTIDFKVNHSHMSKFADGLEAFFACYNENGGKASWSAYTPFTGAQVGVAFRSQDMDWADLDSVDPAVAECSDIYVEQVMPHYEYRSRGIEREWRDVSNWGDGGKVAQVINFDIKDMEKARTMAEMMHAGSAADGRSGYGWTVYLSGRKWDLSYVIVRENFAGLAPPDEGFWDMQKRHHGDEKGAKLRADWMANVKDVSVDFWTWNEGMSNYPDSE